VNGPRDLVRQAIAQMAGTASPAQAPLPDPRAPHVDNGPAFQVQELRTGVPLAYVSEKLANAIRSAHLAWYERGGNGATLTGEAMRQDIFAMGDLLKALLALHGALGLYNDRPLVRQVLEKPPLEVDAWLSEVTQRPVT